MPAAARGEFGKGMGNPVSVFGTLKDSRSYEEDISSGGKKVDIKGLRTL